MTYSPTSIHCDARKEVCPFFLHEIEGIFSQLIDKRLFSISSSVVLLSNLWSFLQIPRTSQRHLRKWDYHRSSYPAEAHRLSSSSFSMPRPGFKNLWGHYSTRPLTLLVSNVISGVVISSSRNWIISKGGVSRGSKNNSLVKRDGRLRSWVQYENVCERLQYSADSTKPAPSNFSG